MPNIMDLNDDWSAGIDTSKWNNWGGLGINSGRLQFVSDIGGSYKGIDTQGKQGYDLTGQCFSNQLIDAGNQSLVSLEVYPCTLEMYGSNDNIVYIFIGTNKLRTYKTVSGITTQLTEIDYDPNIHKWFRIRETAGTTYWEYSTDGFVWSELHSEANPFAMTSMAPLLMIGTWQAEASTTTVLMDNANISPIKAGEKRDSFNTNQRDDSVWEVPANPANVEFQNKRLAITVGATEADYYDLISKGRVDLTGSYVAAQFVDAGNRSLDSSEMIIYVKQDTNDQNQYYCGISGANIFANKWVNGSLSVITSTPYNPDVHKWIRIVEFQGTVYFDYSTNGYNWINFASEASVFELKNVIYGLQHGHWQNEGEASTMIFDNFNMHSDITELQDNFNDNTIDASKWKDWGFGRANEVNRQMEISVEMTVNYYTIISALPYNTQGMRSTVHLVDAGDQSLASFEAIMYLQAEDDFDNKVYISVSGNKITCRKIVNGVNTALAEPIDYDPNIHKFLGFREENGIVYYEYSKDLVNWETMQTLASFFDMAKVKVALQAGNWLDIARTAKTIWDNFNYQTPPQAYLENTNVPLKAGHDYKLSFLVRATRAQNIRLQITDRNGANQSTDQSKAIQANVMKKIAFEFTAAETDVKSIIKLTPDPGVQDIYFDAFNLIDLTENRRQYRVMRIQGSIVPGSFIQTLTLREKTDAETA